MQANAARQKNSAQIIVRNILATLNSAIILSSMSPGLMQMCIANGQSAASPPKPNGSVPPAVMTSAIIPGVTNCQMNSIRIH